MGVLTDEPSQDPRSTGMGGKFVALYDSMDADDQALIRQWDESGMAVYAIWKRVNPKFPIGLTTLGNGLQTLRARWGAAS